MNGVEPPDVRTRRLRNGTLLLLAAAVVVSLALPREWGLPLCGGLLLIALYMGRLWLATGQSRTRFEAPDVLAEEVGSYFERDGVCFAPRLLVDANRTCWFHVLFQNRYANTCDGTVYFIPMEGLAKPGGGSHDVPPIVSDFVLEGGEVGVIRFPYPVAPHWQGKIMVYDVMATVRYPAGEGELIRTPQGTPVGEPTSEVRDAVAMAGLLALGTLHLSRGASRELHLPANVAEVAPPDAAKTARSLWQWRPPTGVAPV